MAKNASKPTEKKAKLAAALKRNMARRKQAVRILGEGSQSLEMIKASQGRAAQAAGASAKREGGASPPSGEIQ